MRKKTDTITKSKKKSVGLGQIKNNILVKDAPVQEVSLFSYPDKKDQKALLEPATKRNFKVSMFSDVDPNNWKNHDEIITDSLWLLGARDKTGVHTGDLHGNFIPQIPHQTMLRYTKKGDVVLDTFSGSGTTMIECRILGRNGVGIELLPESVRKSQSLIDTQSNPYQVNTTVVQGDSSQPETIEKVKALLQDKYKKKSVQLIMMHPPYYDIIKFSANPQDLCNAATQEEFLNKFSDVVHYSSTLLDSKRFLVLVIGDKYSQSQWIPLGFYTMQKVMEQGFKLKSIVIKNMAGNRAKRNAENLWRRRALSGGFYIFKHEYVLIFQKD